MQQFNKYITGETDSVAPQELDRLTGRYEWFTTARRARALLTGTDDPDLVLSLMFSPTIIPLPPRNETRESTGEPVKEVVSVEDEIIGRFLEHGNYRIVPDENIGMEDPITNEVFNADADGEILTEELAEIYRSQGLATEAKEIYRKLSLLNPEKSIYFADIIAQIDAETTNN